MTTAAPPEKMTMEPCPWCGRAPELVAGNRVAICRGGEIFSPEYKRGEHPAIEMVVEEWNRREAARRLSAPAPAAPRVGDDADWRALKKFGRHSAKCTAYQDDDKPCICGYSNAVGAAFDRLISAPPAASADEREDRVQVADEMRSYFYEDAAECSPHKYAEFLQCADIALGYRKLAPAQSVGQSAAQGVALPKVWGVSRMADNEQAVLVSFRRPPTDDELRALHDHLRRLSALPKGQEHEG